MAMPTSAEVTYTELSKAKVSKNRNVVISACSRGGYTIAQQLRVVEDDKVVSIFMKGAITVADLDLLVGLRDAIGAAIEAEEAEIAEDWDEE